MSYVIFTETLRLYPPAAVVDRVCVKPYTLKSDPPMEMHPGEALFIPIIGLHRDPSYYPDPERFDPERFSEDNKHSINPITYLPFGLGPRSCIGKYKFHDSSLSSLPPSQHNHEITIRFLIKIL
jgi:cytochrome P450 family 9